MNYTKDNHSVHLIYLHLIITTKHRHPIITEDINRDIRTLTLDISNKYGIIIDEWNHDKDHIHILMRIPPTVRVSDFVRDVKSRTSREIKKTYNLKKYYWKSHYGVEDILFVQRWSYSRYCKKVYRKSVN